MLFTSFDYVCFLIILLVVYWALPGHRTQNIFLLIASYLFYGWVTPWFCMLLASSSIIDFLIGLGMHRYPERKRQLLIFSLVSNLSFLGFFKYFNFFIENASDALMSFGFSPNLTLLNIVLPVGISFYTFQSLSYTIDIYRGHLAARRSLIDFMLFVSFFPQLVAGPIERATHLIPQIESERKFSWTLFSFGIPLLVRGFAKKLIIADNVSVYADKVFMLDKPSLFLLLAGALAFSVQIFSDFSGYTDIARGSARLIGFELMKNFNFPYLAISPSDFWRRWHISFSSWIRDYLYFSMGGSKGRNVFQYGMVLVITMGLSGFWHGASWHFVIWGIYYAALIFVYRQLGLGTKWRPSSNVTLFLAWLIMSFLTVFGWILFRTPDLHWLANAFQNTVTGLEGSELMVSVTIMTLVALFSIPMIIFMLMDKTLPERKWFHATVYGVLIVVILISIKQKGQDFIYFQF
jgi:alginate O-acetyltransferase complex protein AlgI